ncbi:MAG: hypothetical protein AB4368_12150 [Xenococcaceae cyanobacterium]
MFLNLFDLAIKNPFQKKSRAEHDAKPKSTFFEEKPSKLFNLFNRDREISFRQAKRLGEALGEALKRYDYPSQLKDELVNFVGELGQTGRLFPDMDTVDIWYTDYYDLIQCAEKLGLGDPRLPHWPEEPNDHYRYLELSKNELVNLFTTILNDIVDIETNISSPISIDWDNEIKKISNNPSQTK